MFFLKSKIADGTEIELMNPATNRKCEAKVIWCGETDPQMRTHVGIELVEPGPDFWSVQEQPKVGEEKIEKNYTDAWVD